MIFSNSLGWVILILIALVITVVLAFISKKLFTKIPDIRGHLFLGGIPAVIVMFVIWGMTVSFVVIKPDFTIAENMVLGEAKYTGSDGKEVAIKKVPGHSMLILNESATTMAIEAVVYGTSFGGSEPTVLIEPHSLVPYSHSFDYLPSETPPDQVSVDQHASSTTKYWLRKALEDEVGYDTNDSANASDSASMADKLNAAMQEYKLDSLKEDSAMRAAGH
jgi:hypothetical protein